jgi:DNA mismatch repair protein MutS2
LLTSREGPEKRAADRVADERALELLEFPRVRRTLAGLATCERAKERALALVPSGDLERARRRLADLTEAKRLIERSGEWPAPPREDVGHLLEDTAQGRRLAGGELALITELLAALERSRRFWQEAAEHAPRLTASAGALPDLSSLSRELTRSLDEEGKVRDGASGELRSLRRRIVERRSELRRRLERLVGQGGAWEAAVDEGFLTLREERYLIAVRADRFDRNRGVIHDVSGSGATLFVEPFEALSLNNELREWISAETDEVVRILAALTAQVAEHGEELELAQEMLAEFDELAARVRLSRALDGATPRFDESGDRLRLHRARHPLLWLQAGGDRDRERAAREVVPFDLELVDPVRVLLVSGPNMGGKTVLLKAVGLAVVMALSGLDVCAAEGAALPHLKRIFVDIGDAQSLEENLSTFAARLVRMDAMARTAERGTLCLVDELGAGTDPEEGAALGRSLLQHLAGRGSWVVSTTHLGALKVLAAEHAEVENASMAIDLDRLRPLYTLQIGVPGGSHGLATARRLGMTEEVLRAAEESVSGDALALEALIADLGEELRLSRRRRLELDRRLEAVESQSRRLEQLEEEARASRREIERRRLAELRALEGRARELLRELRREANRASRERDSEALRRLGSGVKELERESDRWQAGGVAAPREAPAKRIEPGVEVKHATLGVVFRVIEGPREDGTVLLAKGAWRTTAQVSDLVAADESREKGAEQVQLRAGFVTSQEGGGESETVAWEVDLRGRFVEDALGELDRALDRAVLAGHREFRIIHGVGRGVLQRAVAKHLGSHEQVKRHRLGVHGEGGRGVTVVELV